MRIPNSPISAKILAGVAAVLFACSAGVWAAPQSASSTPATTSTKANAATNSGTSSGTNSGTGAHHPRRAFRILPHAKAAAKLQPQVPGDPLLVVTSTTNHLETILDPGNPTFYLQSFEKVMVGSSAVVQTDTLMNSSADTTVNIQNISSSDPDDFPLVSTCGESLTPGQSCTFTIDYTPQAECAGSDGLEFVEVDSDDPSSPLDIGLIAGTFDAGGLTATPMANTSEASALALAQSLGGVGVTISNATFTGVANAAGNFGTGGNILGLANGVVLGNGSVVNVIGPNCSTGITGINNQPGDADLTAQIGQPTQDASVLEFDFVPTGNLITFQYVFASDEYQDFVFDFNDGFAFFLNGQNIALVPQTTSIVSINNVNNGSTEPGLTGIPAVNPQFYINNDFQVPAVAPFNTEMDGMTVVLTATAKVNPGVINHIKLAIADARDQEFDSNVFIGAGSLTSTNVQLTPGTLAFGNENQGNTSTAQTVTMTNTGTTPLNNISIATQESGNFTQTNTCGMSLAAGASCAITVTFAPGANSVGVIQEKLEIADSAPDSPQTVTVSGTAVAGPFVTFSPTSLTFGPQNSGTTSPPQTVTVKNTGTAALSITGLQIETDFQAEGSDFQIQSSDCTDGNIAPNATCTINVTWTPSEGASLPETGTVTVSDNAQNQGSQIFGLTGGVTATVMVAPPTLSFGNQAINTSSAAQTITVTNTGSGNLMVPSVVVSAPFAETNTCTANPIAPAGTCTISVTFNPTVAGTFNGTVTITDSAVSSPQMVTVSGTGTAAGMVTIAPTSLTFAAQAIGTTSAPQTVTVTNGGTTPANVAGFSISANFAVATGVGTCDNNQNLAPGTSCTYAITFSPTATGTLLGSFTVTQNAGAPLAVALTGTGTAGAGAITLTPSSLAFGSQTVGTMSAPQTVTVNNTGTTTVTFTSFGVTPGFELGSGMNAGSCIPESNTIPAGGSCTINVQFIPTATGAITGTLTIMDNAGSGQQTAVLSGTGVNSVVTVTVPSGGSTTGTTTPGGTTFFGLIITCAAGQTGTVTLAATSSSNLISVNLIPNMVVCPGGSQQAVQLQTFCQGSTVTTGSLPAGFGGGGIGMALATLLGGIGFAFRRERQAGLALAMVLILMAMGIGACGSLPKSPTGQATPPGTYFISLTTTLNGNVQSLPNFLTLVVK